jgi:hypothetical protein
MALSNNGKHVMLDALASAAGYVSLHTADPGTTGASEVTGGSPAYARKAQTWNAASGGALDNSNAPVFDVPAGTTVTHFGLWSAASAGTFYGGNALSASEAFAAQGTYTLTDCDVTLN